MTNIPEPLSMSDIHALVASGSWSFADFRDAMPKLSLSVAIEQYNAARTSVA